MTCQEFEELSGAYALNAVSRAERAMAQAHLAQCVHCTNLLRELNRVVALLPLSVAQLDPPASLQARLLATIQQESRDIAKQSTLRIQSIQAQEQRQEPVPLSAQREQIRPEIQPAQQMRRTRRQGWGIRALAVAAVLMLALLGGMTVWNISLHQQLASIQVQPPAVTAAYRVRADISAKGSTGQLIYFPDQNLTVLFIHGLPQLQGRQVYQGWLIQGTHSPISVGLLNVKNGVATVAFPGDVTKYDTTAVSLEPGPIASRTPSKVIAMGHLRHQ